MTNAEIVLKLLLSGDYDNLTVSDFAKIVREELEIKEIKK